MERFALIRRASPVRKRIGVSRRSSMFCAAKYIMRRQAYIMSRRDISLRAERARGRAVDDNCYGKRFHRHRAKRQQTPSVFSEVKHLPCSDNDQIKYAKDTYQLSHMLS